MKEKPKAFYKAVFKYWIKNSVVPLIIALILQAIIGYVYYVKKWDMGQTALFILTWEFTKRCFKEREVLHEQKAKKKNSLKSVSVSIHRTIFPFTEPHRS